MNPELPSPQRAPEQMPSQFPQPGEFDVGQRPEQVGERSPEREQYMQSLDQAPQLAPPPAVPLPAPVVVPVPSMAPVQDDATMPTVANDDDLIEKEWVDKAKKIIADTRDDPYRREREVNRLQTDYLMKRYGKELGAAD